MLTWPAGSSFDATGFQVVQGDRVVARSLSGLERARPKRLKITKRRTARSLDVRIKRLKPGRLRFKVRATRVAGRTRMTIKIRQSKRG